MEAKFSAVISIRLTFPFVPMEGQAQLENAETEHK